MKTVLPIPLVLSLFAVWVTGVTPAYGITKKQIWDYQSEFRHKDAASLSLKEFNSLAAKYAVATEAKKKQLVYGVLESFYKLGWSQAYGRLYLENIKAYNTFMKLKIPVKMWGDKMLWTVRSAFGIATLFASRGKYKTALSWIDWVERLYKLSPYQKRDKKHVNPFRTFYNNGYDFYGFKRFVKAKLKLKNKKPTYTMTVLYLAYPKVDYTAVYFGVKKGRVKRSYTWNKRDWLNLMVAQQSMKLAVEAMSHGNLSLKFITKKMPLRVFHNPKKRSGIYSTPKVSKARSAIMRSNPHDLMVDHILSNDTGASGHGGGNHMALYHLPNSTATWTTLVHEFFHCVESHFGWKAHLYRIKNGVPGWNGILWDQMSYYTWRFQNHISALVKKDTRRYKTSGWITRFNWGPKSLRPKPIMPPTPTLP